MNIGKYRVHRVNEVPQVVNVTFEGITTTATVTGLEIELVPVDNPRMGSITLRFVGQDVDAAKAEFLVDRDGVLSWTTLPSN